MIERLKRPLIAMLRWSERYTKTDMVYLASGGFWLGLGQAVSSLSALALAVAFANLVPPETYGTYKYILSIAGMFAIFSLPGLSTAVTRAVAQGHEGVIHAATRSRVAHSFVGSVIALGGASYYFLNDNIELSLALLIIAATLPVFDTFTLYLAHLVGRKRFDLRAFFNSLTHIVSTGILIGTLFLTDDIATILLAYFIPLSVIRIVLYYRVKRSAPEDLAVENIDESKKTLVYGKKLTGISILSVIAANLDKVLLWKFLGPMQLAIYAFAIAIPEQIKGPVKDVGELAFPKFAAQSAEQIRSSMTHLYWKLFLYTTGLFVIALLYSVAAPFIFTYIFPQYLDSVAYSQLFVFSLVAMSAPLLVKILESQGKIQHQLFIGTIQPIIRIALFVVLIPLFGVLGAIYAIMIDRVIYFIVAFVLIHRI